MKKAVFFTVVFAFGLWFLGLPKRSLATEVVVSSSSAVMNSEPQEVIPALDLTVPKVKIDRMAALLGANEIKKVTPLNFLRAGVKKAVENGVSVNTVVLLFLFPLVATLVAFSRQVVGLNGFGMITPALLAMAFLSTGGLVGIIMLGFVVGVATLGKMAIKKVRIPYLPKLATLIWIVSMAVLGLILTSPFSGLSSFLEIGIFPIILFVSVAETFIEAQITRSFSTSMTMMIETIILAFLGYKLMNSHLVQSLVILNPEQMTLFILLLNLLIGRYKGLRLLEMWRFRKLILR